jgi:GntR family transcriptional regulator
MTNGTMPLLKTNRLSLPIRARDYLLGLIQDGTYQPGEQLPSEKELGISRPTLREALNSLEQDGLVIRKHGVGTFVAPGYDHRLESGLERLESILELAARQGMILKFDALQIHEEPAPAELSAKLRVEPGTPLTHIRRVIKVGKKPVAYMLDIVPSSVISAEDINEAFNGSVLDLIRRKREVRIAQAVADIIALDAADSLAKKLDIESDRAVLLLEEVLFDEEGFVVEFSQNYFNPEYVRFHIVRR